METEKKSWSFADLLGKQIKSIKTSSSGTKLFVEFDNSLTLNLESASKIAPLLAVKEMKLVETKHQITDLVLAE